MACLHDVQILSEYIAYRGPSGTGPDVVQRSAAVKAITQLASDLHVGGLRHPASQIEDDSHGILSQLFLNYSLPNPAAVTSAQSLTKPTMGSQPNLQPIQLWGRRGPNPPKVTMILEELGLPYEHIPIEFKDVKQPEYLAINPNGRLPAIRDPNSGLTLWESGAIIEYLVERYDTDRRLSFAPGTNDAYHTRQWLYFQASGQGPYFGQATWFKMYHHEKVPSAFERFKTEVNRVSGVLEAYLESQRSAAGEGGGPWLVGGKMTFADIAFIPWYCWMDWMLDDEEFKLDDYPTVKDWLDRMRARPSVTKVLTDIKPANAKK
ncbi:hypothetical protein CHGG_00383 [Chaetomium globosum CBS 148.51]|uniref:Protein URE2 n=1 Tax=Chaetomium globosum (strain ATCC 6205 / CBS 148.51 / DSM 1962 / NBRC 6347 / NRRL 1970) TaxID=306901 RepID=Q2HHC1_CHAGB|nr:uncharacterized protein CHGG_00383 [Chaetomium globosum CBS 148.51]EAQ92148.1 hypothetical protein CHGG_00383 [Chaetomium globosum CBS 148.51]